LVYDFKDYSIAGGLFVDKKKRKIDIFSHELVPKHILLSKEEAEKLLNELNIYPEQLPWIKKSDPAVVAIGAKPGDIIKIIRKSSTAGEVVIYRYVIDK